MTDNADLHWRPIQVGDVAQWAVLAAAAEQADGELDHTSEQELSELLAAPDCDFADGSIAAYDGDVMVAAAFVLPRSSADPVHDMRLGGMVHPGYRRRGIGGQVLDWAEQGAITVHDKMHPGRPLALHGWSVSGHTGAAALFEAHDYRAVRWWRKMRMDLSAVPPAAAEPDGVQILSFSQGISEQGINEQQMIEDARLVRNEAFQDHWGSTESTAQAWAHSLGQHGFRPGFSYLAYAGGQAVGVLLGFEHEANTKATGSRDLYIGIVGTRRAGRNRGIASALMSRALADGKADGFATSSLLVDGDSLTGAVGLYERIGFGTEQTNITWAKDLIAAG